MAADQQGGWRNRIVGHGQQAASQFVANPYNWRTHPMAQRRAVRGSLDELGWIDTVIVNKTTGNLVDGHERVWQALQAGDAVVPYIEVELTEQEELLALSVLDPIAALASTDAGKYNELLQMIQTDNENLQEVLAKVAGDAGLYADAPQDGLPEGLPEPELEGWGDVTPRVIIVFDSDEQRTAFWHRLGVASRPGIIHRYTDVLAGITEEGEGAGDA